MEITETLTFQALVILATITGFGITLDQLFITPHIREKLEEYLTVPRANRTWFERYRDLLGLSEAVVFDKYFRGTIVSLQFLKSSFAVSTLSFTIAVAIQYFFFSEYLPQFTFTAVQVVTIGSFFMFNLVMDVVTIAQTRAFIRASVSSDKPFNSIVFFGSDILVTLNVFILTYAAFLLALVQFFTVPEQSVKASITASSWIEVGGDIYKGSDNLKGLQETQIFYSLSSEGGNIQRTFDILSTDAVNPIEAVYAMQILYGGSLKILDFDQFSTKDIDEIIGSDLRMRFLRQDDRSIALSDPEVFPDFDPDKGDLLSRFVVRLDLDLVGVKPNLRNLGMLYTPAFLTVDALEDNFPYAMFNSTGWVSMEDFIGTYNRAQLIDLSQAAVICEANGLYSFSSQNDEFIDSATPESLTGECDQSYIIRSSDWIENRMTLASFSRGVEVYLPFSAMFITSMLPTVLLYLVMLAIAGSATIHRSLIGRAARLGDLIVKQPIGFFCFLFASVAAAYTLIT